MPTWECDNPQKVTGFMFSLIFLVGIYFFGKLIFELIVPAKAIGHSEIMYAVRTAIPLLFTFVTYNYVVRTMFHRYVFLYILLIWVLDIGILLGRGLFR